MVTVTLRRLRWLAPALVLAFAALLRLWMLTRPGTLVFDELYYVRDAVSQLANGFPTTWPDDETTFDASRAAAFSTTASTIAHPPLGKWLIGLGVLLFGADNGLGWRFAVAVAGIVTVALTMRLGWLMTKSLTIASLAGLLLAVDGVHVVMSRVSVLDGFLTLLVLTGALFVWRDQAARTRRWSGADLLSRAQARAARRARFSGGPIVWGRPWLVAAGVAFGAAAGVKWSGLYPLAAFLVVITLRDWWLRRRLRVRRPWFGTLAQAAVAALLTLPVAVAAYLASWIGWILSPGGQNRHEGEPWWVSLWQWHRDALAWHTTLSAPHPYQANPLTWPLDLRPTFMYLRTWGTEQGCPWSGGCAAVISPLPNPLVTWGGVAALLLLLWVVGCALWRAVRPHRPAAPGSRPARRSALPHPAIWVAGFTLTGYLSGWLPWVATVSRSAVFEFYAVVLTPFAALALALVLGAIAGRPAVWRPGLLALAGWRLRASPEAIMGRRITVAIIAVAAVVLGLLFYPVWIGLPVADWFWRAHLWLPGWV